MNSVHFCTFQFPILCSYKNPKEEQSQWISPHQHSNRFPFPPPFFFQAFQPLIHVFLLRISLPSTPDIVERSKRGENGTGALAKSRQKVSSVEIAIFHSWTVFLTVSLSRKHCDLFARAVTDGDGGVRRQPILRIARRAINWIPRTRA